MSDKVMISPKEFGYKVSLSEGYIRQLCNQGVIKFKKQGRRVLIPVTELTRFSSLPKAPDETEADLIFQRAMSM